MAKKTNGWMIATWILVGILVLGTIIGFISFGNNSEKSLQNTINRLEGERDFLARMMCNDQGLKWANCDLNNGDSFREPTIQTNNYADGKTDFDLICCNSVLKIPDQLK